MVGVISRNLSFLTAGAYSLRQNSSVRKRAAIFCR
jgi:hypothetical protein